MKKIYLVILLTLLFLIPNVVKAENKTPQVDANKKVYDFADKLTDEEEERLHTMAIDYNEKYKMEMVLVIIDENPYGIADEYTRLYSQDFYDFNDFGKDGMIILIDLANRYPYITTTGQAVLYYDDERINVMHDEAYGYLATDNYYEAFSTYINKAAYYIEAGIPESNQYYCVDEDGEYYKCKSAPKAVNWIITSISAALGSIIPFGVHTRKYRGVKLATNASQYLKSAELTDKTDQFLTTFTSRVRRSESSSSGGGGGSTISRGSSGRSHGGGGGRHF